MTPTHSPSGMYQYIHVVTMADENLVILLSNMANVARSTVLIGL